MGAGVGAVYTVTLLPPPLGYQRNREHLDADGRPVFRRCIAYQQRQVARFAAAMARPA